MISVSTGPFDISHMGEGSHPFPWNSFEAELKSPGEMIRSWRCPWVFCCTIQPDPVYGQSRHYILHVKF